MPVTPPEARTARRRWWSRRKATAAAPAKARNRTRFGFSTSYTRGDIALFTSGFVLAGFCAVFPWYVFMNQDQFSEPRVKLGNIPSSGPAPRNWNPASRTGEDSLAESSKESGIDTFTTGTTPPPAKEEEQTEIVPQPFPAGPPPQYELVHVANGRAMIQDDKGLYVVQRGSLLPDNSRVAKIEKRDGRWVLVTSANRVLEVEN
jgi:hypothetical protein